MVCIDITGQADGHTSLTVLACLATRGPQFQAANEVVVIDPHN
jgi:hypothetical protein